ncbi:MAG TPA: hypothetical protein VFZ09_27510 [Archangium sp.]|uniref:hypothetical protein n=1 Tax=Archangium sp. TaxID=1872627 RepID=UPI002E2EDD0B|nr:hypothetical protein [Archangium sp.]HEX5750008.1 hypothetical protein [Archangium sp.]
MPCPVPSHLPTPPSLSTLLEELATVDLARAEAFRANVVDVETRQLQAREQLAKAESALSLVKADGTLSAQADWNLRYMEVSGRRKNLRLLGVDADSLRGELERQLFLARQSQAIGRAVCSACGGTGDDEGSDGGTSVVVTSCDPCRGTGYVPARPSA